MQNDYESITGQERSVLFSFHIRNFSVDIYFNGDIQSLFTIYKQKFQELFNKFFVENGFAKIYEKI